MMRVIRRLKVVNILLWSLLYLCVFHPAAFRITKPNSNKLFFFKRRETQVLVRAVAEMK